MLVTTIIRIHNQEFKLLQKIMQNLKQQNQHLQDQTIETLIADREKFDKLNKELQVKLEKANDYKNTLIDKLR